MIKENFSTASRKNKTIELNTQFVIAGGGLAGTCAAITAARAGRKVILVQDRPVLGGNASSEVRLWALGATSHMGNNNRWSREGGVIDEIMLDNMKVNSQGNPLIFDALLLDKVVAEKNITLLLNTAVFQVNKSDDTTISSIEAFCSQNSTHYVIAAPLFCDATGDGLVAFNAGAAFRIGAESKDEFNEQLASDEANNELLGHTLFFYSKKAGKPVSYKAPAFAYTQEEIGAIPRCKDIHGTDSGCKFWWIEFGGIRDTIYETEEIKWELWKIVYGIWDYIKNSGKFEDVDDLTLEWVGTVPGKRESRRFEGEYMLKQQDIVEQTQFDDAVSYGGWAIDIHPAEGIYSNRPACSQFHSKGVYQIPYRSFVSRDIDNLFLAGRIISATHMAFGSTRVMITCAHGGQAVGEAAAMCSELSLQPKALLTSDKMQTLQQRLNSFGHGIPGIALDKSLNLATLADVKASSEFALSGYENSGETVSLAQSVAQLLPFNNGPAPKVTIQLIAKQATELTCQLRVSSKAENYTPDVTLKTIILPVLKGKQSLSFDFSDVVTLEQYGFICFLANDDIELANSTQRVTGTMPVFNKVHKAVSNNGKQTAPVNSGIDEFEFWTPERRPKGQNLALTFTPALNSFSVSNVLNGHLRPWLSSNAWVANWQDKQPSLCFTWPSETTISTVALFFDTDSDHALETVLMEHSENQMPYCVTSYRLKLADGTLLAEVSDNYQTVNKIVLPMPVTTKQLIIEIDHPSADVPASLFEVQIN
ncbi:FAD-dependent oxidoreductase [Psychrosphaera sp. 1_MG-2023]|uniref:FAD-dependent oxidoreductase n=1 Tax=Psychrosphaera sp. 1_MG-2023 TaxID=3062643 RepID=UPI0026E1D784|nr:FAD-dependent oxidoreductase [Psychrosphaera sp. 1_MG-2023]MDO6718795.1 FAD-dependent oxidoreductase [Psychrosphaera sp. 1_MG-2023]